MINIIVTNSSYYLLSDGDILVIDLVTTSLPN